MFCKNCGHEIKDVQLFCPECGSPTPAKASPPVASPQISSPFSAEPIAYSAPDTRVPAPKKSKTWLMILLSVILTLALAAGAYFGIFWDDLFGEDTSEASQSEKSFSSPKAKFSIYGEWSTKINLNNMVKNLPTEQREVFEDFETTAQISIWLNFERDGTYTVRMNAEEFSTAIETLMNEMIFYIGTMPEIEAKMVQQGLTLTDLKEYIMNQSNIDGQLSSLLAEADDKGNIYSDSRSYYYSDKILTLEMNDNTVYLTIAPNSKGFTVMDFSSGGEFFGESVWVAKVFKLEPGFETHIFRSASLQCS